MRQRNDLSLYEERAEGFNDPEDRYFASLRSVGDFHVSLLRRWWGDVLAASRVADLGCGGGRIAAALAGLGARVTGIDRSFPAVRVARREARRLGRDAHFVQGDLLDSPLASEHFDMVLLADVLEHLEAPQAAVREAARLLVPGGRLFLNTFDRTRCSAIAVVHVAEGLGFVPRGTHDPRLFVRPAELEGYAEGAGMRLERIVWERPVLLRSLRTWTIHLAEARRGFGFSAFLTKCA